MLTRLNTPILKGASSSDCGGRLPRNLGRYELIARLGDGGMADVYLARKRGLLKFRKLVVVKTIKSRFANDPRFIKLLLDEARHSALLKHPNVIDIYDLGFEDETYFIAMEYLPGQSLTSIIQRSIHEQQWLDVFSSAQIIADAAEGLSAVHALQGLDGKPLDMVHGDISPGNIVVLYNGHVKLVDFGVSKVRWKRGMVGSQTRAFKLGYAAPEQLLGDALTPVSDIYSLGVAMWELLTHRRLHTVETPRQALRIMIDSPAIAPSKMRSEIHPRLDAICLRALQIDSRERYQSAKEMQHDLEAVLRDNHRFRESDHIEAFMGAMFSHVREQHAELVRAISARTSFLDLNDLMPGEVEIDVDGGETIFAPAAPPIDHSAREFDRKTEVLFEPELPIPALPPSLAMGSHDHLDIATLVDAREPTFDGHLVTSGPPLASSSRPQSVAGLLHASRQLHLAIVLALIAFVAVVVLAVTTAPGVQDAASQDSLDTGPTKKNGSTP